MNKLKPYLMTGLTVLAVLVVYKLVIQPYAPDSLKKYLPSV